MKRVVVFFICCILSFFSVCFAKSTKNLFAGGSGTKTDPYQIATCLELQNMAQDLNGHFALANDIDCTDTKNWNNGAGFSPVGTSDTNSFKGSFNGNFHVITNLYIYRPTTDKVALFGDLYGSVSNVGIENAQITGHNGAAGLVGWNVGGTIFQSYATGNIQGFGNAVGGLVGQSAGVIAASFSTAHVTGAGYVGGLVGSNYQTVLDSYATGTVKANNTYVGGFVGSNWADIENSYSTGSVSGSGGVGGFAGFNYYSNTTIKNSYWDTQTSGKSSSAGGVGKTTAQLQEQSTFTDWNFVNTWNLNPRVSYPRLGWEPVSLAVSFSAVSSPQKIKTPFAVTLSANKSTYSGKVYLYSALGPVYPEYVNLVDGQWSGLVTLYSVGKHDALYVRWDDPTGSGNNTSISNTFDVTNQAGDIPTDARLRGRVVRDDSNTRLAGASVQLYSGNPAGGGVPVTPVVVTDSEGQYDFTNVAPGQFYLKIQASGYEDYIKVIKLSSQRIISDTDMIALSCPVSELTPLLLVPGIMGSSIMSSWVYPRLPKEFPRWDSKELQLHDPSLQGYFSKVGWSDLEALLEKNGYQKGCTLFEVPYDWTLSNTAIRDKYLIPWIQYIKEKTKSEKVDIVAHSMGGLVTRAYLQSQNYASDVRKFVMAGTPNKGAGNPYYIWEGGDPIAADKNADEIARKTGEKESIIGLGQFFYTNTLNYLYQDRAEGDVCKFGYLGLDYTPTSCDNEKIYLFAHEQAPSPGVLMPIYENALLNASVPGETVPIKKEENQFIKALNGLTCDNPNGCQDSYGKHYVFQPSTSVLTADDSGVQTKLFLGDGVDTVQNIMVEPRLDNYTGLVYKDGNPQSKQFGATGDGSVLKSSVLLDSLPYEEKADASHESLIKIFKTDIAKFITGNDQLLPVEEASTEEPSLFIIEIDGRVQPSISSVVDQAGKQLIFSSDNDFELGYSDVVVSNPYDGAYTVNLNSPYYEDYVMSILYVDPEQQAIESRRVIGFYDENQTRATFTVKLNTQVSDHHLIFGRSFEVPHDLTMQNDSNKIKLTWQDDIGNTKADVDYYEIYWKTDKQPFYSYLGRTQSNELSYLTTHSWASAPSNIYIVRAMLKNGESTFFSPSEFYIAH